MGSDPFYGEGRMEKNYTELFKRVANGNDVRGVVLATESEKVSLEPWMVVCIAQAFSDFLAEAGGKEKGTLRIGIGHDSRITAPQMTKAALAGLYQVKAFDCGLITTPAMFQSTVLEDSHFDGAIMITASHLPFNRNGMKFFTGEGAIGKAQLGDILQKAAAIAEAEPAMETDEASWADRRGEVQTFDMQNVYCSHMQDVIKKTVAADDYEHPLKGLHIVEDAGNGAAGFFAEKILAPLGADISGSVFMDPDGSFPNHVPNPEDPAAMDAARKAVLDAKADLGVIFDCDGDRGAVVFSDGTEVNRNKLIALLSVIVSEQSPGSAVVTDSVTSDELAEFLTEKLGMEHLRFKRGYKNVIDKGIELNKQGKVCELAIETSGHGAFRENYFSDDGAYIAVKIICKMAALLKENRRIEELIADLKNPAEAKEMRYHIQAEDFKAYGASVLDAFRTFCENQPGFRIVEPNYEGIRAAFNLDGADGWVLLRMSLHDPVLPMNIETKQAGGVEIIRRKLDDFFRGFDALKE